MVTKYWLNECHEDQCRKHLANNKDDLIATLYIEKDPSIKNS